MATNGLYITTVRTLIRVIIINHVFSDSDKVLEHGCLIFMRAVKVKDLRFCCREKGKQACDSDFASRSFCLTVRETFKHLLSFLFAQF